MKKAFLSILALSSALISMSSARAGDYDRYRCQCGLFFMSSQINGALFGWDSDLIVFGRDDIDAEIAGKAECSKRQPVSDGIGHTYYPALVRGSCQKV